MGLKSKGNTNLIVIVILLVLVVGGGYFLFNQNISSPSILETQNEPVPSLAPVIGESAGVIAHTKEAYDEAFASNKLVVLYFYANWCPICRVEFPVFEKAIQNFSADEVVGIQINFNDSQTDNDEEALAREYDIAYQHHKIFLKNGKVILSAPQEWTEAQYLTEISKALE